MVTTTSFSTLQPSSSAMMAAVSKSIIWLKEAMTPFFIRHLTTSAPVFFMRLASSPTEISSGICTVTGVFLMTSRRSLRRRSASSCLRLLLAKLLSRRCLLRNFSLPWGACCSRLPPPVRASAMSCSFSSYLSRFTLVALRVSTTCFWGTRDMGFCSGLAAFCWGTACWGFAPAGAAACWGFCWA